MQIFKRLLTRSAISPKWAPAALAVTAFVGLTDALYLTIKHFTNSVPNCTLLSGCAEVTTSVYSTFLNIPVALLGSIFYLTILLLSVFVLDRKDARVFHFLCLLSPLGFLASLWFVFLQLFILKAICLYCMVSAVTSTVIFVIGVLGLRNKYKV